MEGRRVEGVFLDTGILRSKAQEAYASARNFEIKLLSQVSEALLSSLRESGGGMPATILGVGGNTVRLLLSNGYEISAENRLSVPVREGERVLLTLESENPVILRVQRMLGGLREIGNILSGFKDVRWPAMNPEDTAGAVFNSGLFYERKVWEFLKGNVDFEALKGDLKFALLSGIDQKEVLKLAEAIGGMRVPERIEPLVERLLSSARSGDRTAFINALRELYPLVHEEISRLDSFLAGIIKKAGEVRNTFAELVRNQLMSVGVKAVLTQKPSIPATPTDVLRWIGETIKSLEGGKVEEFIKYLNAGGVEVRDVPKLMDKRDILLPSLRVVSERMSEEILQYSGAENPDRLKGIVEGTKRELNELVVVRNVIENTSQEIKNTLIRLELLSLLQWFMVSKEGRRFIFPFTAEGSKGVFAFSSDDHFRIYIKFGLEIGYISVLLQSPKKDSPDFLSILIKTDSERVKEAIDLYKNGLEKEITSLGLELRGFEVIIEREGDADREFLEEFGGDTLLNLRV